jgi:hypothetical protein
MDMCCLVDDGDAALGGHRLKPSEQRLAVPAHGMGCQDHQDCAIAICVPLEFVEREGRVGHGIVQDTQQADLSDIMAV